MKILVTGGAGFIGSHVVDSYIDAGHDVTVIDNLSTGRIQNVNPKANFIEVDILSDDISNLLGKEKFDVINHHAAQIDVRKSTVDPIFDANVNILGTLNLLEAGIKNGLKRFIFASTGGAIYGEQDYFPADENHPQRPISPYGIGKLTVEKYLYYYGIQYGLDYIVLRYANVFGPRQNPFGEAGVVAIFCERLISGKEAIINGDGEQTRDYVFVYDVVKANLLALETEYKREIFNIGTGTETDVNTIFRKIRSLIDSTKREVHGAAKQGEQQRSVINPTKAKKMLGWQPKYNLDIGLKITVDYFKLGKLR
jgi:UDP-glucose 4-epimerase